MVINPSQHMEDLATVQFTNTGHQLFFRVKILRWSSGVSFAAPYWFDAALVAGQGIPVTPRF